MPKVTILTGPTAAWKSSVAKAIVAQSERCALVEYDRIHEMFAKPHMPPWTPEWILQQRLGVRMVCDIAARFLVDGYDVIITDVISDDTSDQYRDLLAWLDLRIIQLLPPFDILKKRFDDRGPVLTDEELANVYREQENFEKYDRRIDNTDISPQDIAKIILK